MNAHPGKRIDDDRIKQLLKHALPPVEPDAEPARESLALGAQPPRLGTRGDGPRLTAPQLGSTWRSSPVSSSSRPHSLPTIPVFTGVFFLRAPCSSGELGDKV